MFITMSVIKNRMHEDFKFKEWLEHLYKFADKIVLLDNNSNDGTNGFVEEFPDPDNKIVLIDEVTEDFATQESTIRAMCWEAIRKRCKEGDYVLVIDSDEFLEESFIKNKDKVLSYMDKKNIDTALFKFCDMWSEDEYRIDGMWSPCFPRLFKFKNESWGPTGSGLHLNNIPMYALQTKNCELLPYRVLHYSYHTEAIRKNKYDYYMERSVGDNLEHAKTIIQTPVLKKIDDIDKPKIMVCSLLRNRDWIVKDFLKGLEKLNYPKDKLSFYFIVNNSSDDTMKLLDAWGRKHEKDYPFIIVEEINFGNAGEDKERNWQPGVIMNMAFMRNLHLKKLQEQNFDYALSVDSDLLLHPDVLIDTLLMDKLVVSPVFWAKWDGKDAGHAWPQCWINGPYHISKEWLEFLLTHKARVRCGGLGALTLIDKTITQYPQVNYNHVYNLGREFWGEDRWFCTRCSVFSIDLWCHTYVESRHVDKKEDLLEHLKYIEDNHWWDDDWLLINRR